MAPQEQDWPIMRLSEAVASGRILVGEGTCFYLALQFLVLLLFLRLKNTEEKRENEDIWRGGTCKAEQHLTQELHHTPKGAS